MPLYVPSDEVTEIHVGSTELSKYYVGSNEIWSSVPPPPPYIPYTPANAVNQGSLPSGVVTPSAITYDGTQFLIEDADNLAFWILANASNPGSAILNDFTEGHGGYALAYDGTQFISLGLVGSDFRLYTFADIEDSEEDQGNLPSGLSNPTGMTWDSINSQLVFVDKTDDDLWTLARNNNGSYTPANVRRQGAFPGALRRPEGITHDGIRLVIADRQGREIWTLDDATSPGDAVNRGQLPGGLTGINGMTWDSDNSRLVMIDEAGNEIWTLARNAEMEMP